MFRQLAIRDGVAVDGVDLSTARILKNRCGMERLERLARAIQGDSERILTDWKSRVRQLPNATRVDTLTLEDHFPAVLDEISTALMWHQQEGTLARPSSATEHGRQRFTIGFDLHQMIIEYNALRQVLRECAERHRISLDGIAGAVLSGYLATVNRPGELTVRRRVRRTTNARERRD